MFSASRSLPIVWLADVLFAALRDFVRRELADARMERHPATRQSVHPVPPCSVPTYRGGTWLLLGNSNAPRAIAPKARTIAHLTWSARLQIYSFGGCSWMSNTVPRMKRANVL
jgi:hypothetical protein